MIKLIATDMDGTLLDENSKLNNEFFNILDEMYHKGIKFVAASGRQYYTLVNNFNGEKEKVIYVAENGTYVVYNEEEIYSNLMKFEDALCIIEEARKLDGVNIILCGKKSAYYESDSEEFINEVNKYYHKNKKVEDLTKVKDEILKVALCDFNGAKENSLEALKPIFDEKLMLVVSGAIWLDLMNKNVNKGQAIKALQEKFEIPFEKTMVFGDYYNDLEMLKSAYHSYAMENAPEDLKQHARFVAKSNRDNGVIEKIKEKVLCV